MSQAIKNHQETHGELQSLYAVIRDELAEVDQVLQRELSSRYPFVDQLVKHGFRLGGKRLRPALVLLSGKLCGRLCPEHLALAAVVEMVHTATLVHDDVLDEAALRRHRDTINARWNNEASILLGDYMFTRAMCLASSVDSTFACRSISEAGRTMCEGELRQIETRGNYDLAEEEYISIIGGKTAALCACCCRLGAHSAGADDDRIEALGRFGHNLGVAFQIVDDVLDILGDEQTTGKSLGTDLAKQKPTLPVIRLLAQSTPKQRTQIVEQLSEAEAHHCEILRSWLNGSDAIEYSRQKAAEFIRMAIGELEDLPKTPARDTLREIAQFVVARRH